MITWRISICSCKVFLQFSLQRETCLLQCMGVLSLNRTRCFVSEDGILNHISKISNLKIWKWTIYVILHFQHAVLSMQWSKALKFKKKKDRNKMSRFSSLFSFSKWLESCHIISPNGWDNAQTYQSIAIIVNIVENASTRSPVQHTILRLL